MFLSGNLPSPSCSLMETKPNRILVVLIPWHSSSLDLSLSTASDFSAALLQYRQPQSGRCVWSQGWSDPNFCCTILTIRGGMCFSCFFHVFLFLPNGCCVWTSRQHLAGAHTCCTIFINRDTGQGCISWYHSLHRHLKVTMQVKWLWAARCAHFLPTPTQSKHADISSSLKVKLARESLL